MSRIGKMIINIPDKTTVTVDAGMVTVKGPNGELKKEYNPRLVEIKVDGSNISFEKKGETKEANSLWGTYSSHVRNMVNGVNTPYVKKLILEGVGFKSEVAGDKLKLALGFSHPVEEQIPTGLTVTAEKNLITITGIDKELVGSFSAYIRSLKKPEPYKGKGFRYEDEVIRRKQGKKTAQ